MAKPNGVIYSSANSLQYPKLYNINHGAHPYKQGNGYLKFSTERLCIFRGKVYASSGPRSSSFICQSTETRNKETKKCTKHRDDRPDTSSSESGLERCVVTGMNVSQSQGIAEACKFAYNDAKYVNERAKKDLVLLSRGILRMDARARQDVAFLGSEFLKLDARAREDTEKIDSDVKRKAERLHHIAMILKNKAQSKLKTAADKHWSDGALEADLKRADSAAKQRAMEDSLMALEFVKNMHDMMVSKTNRLKNDRTRTSEVTERITLEKNGKTLDMEISAERIKALQEAYWDIASALSEADGIDYTDPEELELLVTTLIDLDAMDGKSSVSLLAEASSSPDDSTRKALANALSAAPSMWTLGNAGMGALQRLADDSNPAIAEAASKTIKELKKQWEIEEGDNWRFMMSQELSDEIDDDYKDANE